MPVSKQKSEEDLSPPNKRRRSSNVVDLDMSLLNQDFNWYQDHNYVTASVKISQKNLKNYRAEFTDTGFTVYANDGLLWECKLCGTIVPTKCKLKPGTVRVEVKLKKQGMAAWSDFCHKNDSKVYNPIKILSQSDETVSTAPEKEASLPPSSTAEDTNLQSLPVGDSSIANSVPNTTNSVLTTESPLLNVTNSKPDTANSKSDTANSIPDIASSLPDTEPVAAVPTDTAEPKIVPADSNSVSGTPNHDSVLETPNEDMEFIDYMNLPDPLEQSCSSERRDTEPRRAAASFNITGADPIASSGDHAVDSNDVIILPEATEDTELEISYLVHDWIDKIPNPVVEIVIPIRSFDANSLRVRFFEDSFKVIFKTRAEMFLKMIPGATENSFIYWKPKLFGKIVPKESKHWVQMPKLYVQLKKAPPFHRWKSLEAPSSPAVDSQPSVTEMPRMGSEDSSKMDTPHQTSRNIITNGPSTTTTTTTRLLPSGPQNVAKPVDKPKSSSLASGAGNAAAAVKAGTVVKLVDTSYAGLINIGNTCYMNSIIQSLSNTHELRDYLIHGTFTKERNTTNPLGYKGRLVDSFASLLKKLWTGQHQKLSPHSVLSLMASKYNQFSERSQHDAHEFMSFLLDGLHEDINRVVAKPNTATVEQNNRPDQEVAQEAWEVYRKRNDSFIVDTFQGQFKSTLYCTKCTTMSVTFDPFSCLSVPLPKKMRLLSVILLRRDPSITPVKYMLKLPHDSTLELLKASVGKRAGILMTNLRVFEAYKGKIQMSMSSNKMSIERIDDNDMIIVSEVLSEKEAGREVVEISVLQRIMVPFHPTACALCQKSGTASSLKRCMQCLAVAYCNRACQEKHWTSVHRVKCKSLRQPPTMGVPFIVSLPKSQCTYRNLADAAEKLARHSVNVDRGEVQQSASNQTPSGNSATVSNSTASIGSNSSTMTSAEQQSPQAVNKDSAEGGASSTTSSGVSPVTMDTSSSSLHNHIEEVPVIEKPKFVFTPVNRFGHAANEEAKIRDTGERLIDLNNVQCLALDWNNNPKQKGYIKVTEKQPFYNEDSSCSTTYTDETESGPATLQKCVQLFTEPETLSSDEAWYCPKCKEHQEAIKQMSLWRLPKILIIQLKRFTYQNCIWKDKIDKNVSFPLKELNMSKYVEENALKDTSVTTHPPVYDLYATVNHFGSVFFGHYTAYVQSHEDDKWLLYDDDSVRNCKAAEVNNQHAYLLFYRMRNS